MFSIPAARLLVAGVILGILSLGLATTNRDTASISISSVNHDLELQEQFTATLFVSAHEPVNVFKGILEYDPMKLRIVAIDYNTSIADLWAELPWYSNGDGTLTFIGGTTRPGGFTGNEQLITITFETRAAGKTSLHMRDVRILRHDGFGTDALISQPIDAIFTIAPQTLKSETVTQKDLVTGPRLTVRAPAETTDLNGDGEKTLADTSIFMIHLAKQNLRSDFNHDGVVNLVDLSILNQ